MTPIYIVSAVAGVLIGLFITGLIVKKLKKAKKIEVSPVSECEVTEEAKMEPMTLQDPEVMKA